jgi:hypothetical protein
MRSDNQVGSSGIRVATVFSRRDVERDCELHRAALVLGLKVLWNQIAPEFLNRQDKSAWTTHARIVVTKLVTLAGY